MIRVLLAGGYDTENVGDHAMLRMLVRDLRRHDPGTIVTLLSRHPDPAFDRAFGVESIRNLDHESREAAQGRWFNGFNPGDDTAHLARLRAAVAETDVVVIGGGRLLVDISLGFLRGPLPYLAGLVMLARLFEKPVFIFGMTLVPIASETGRELARFILTNAETVTVREEASAERARALGVADERLHVLPDPAFGLADEVDAERGAASLLANGVPRDGRRLIAMAVRHVYWQQDDEAFDRFSRELAAIADGLVERLDADVVFVPHCTYTRHHPLVDDRRVAARVHAEMTRPARAHELLDAVSLPASLGVYAHMDLLVSQRRHAIAFAALSGVPAVALSDGENVRTMMARLGQEDRVLPLRDTRAEQTIDVAADAWRRRNAIGGELRSIVARLARHTPSYTDLLVHQINRS